MSALTRNRAPGTIPNDLMQEYYVQRSGAGLIVTEGILVSRQGYEANSRMNMISQLIETIIALNGHSRLEYGTRSRSSPGRKLSTLSTPPALIFTLR